MPHEDAGEKRPPALGWHHDGLCPAWCVSGESHIADLVANGEYWHEGARVVVPSGTGPGRHDATITLQSVQQEKFGTPGLYRHAPAILIGNTRLTAAHARDLAAALTALSYTLDPTLAAPPDPSPHHQQNPREAG